MEGGLIVTDNRRALPHSVVTACTWLEPATRSTTTYAVPKRDDPFEESVQASVLPGYNVASRLELEEMRLVSSRSNACRTLLQSDAKVACSCRQVLGPASGNLDSAGEYRREQLVRFQSGYSTRRRAIRQKSFVEIGSIPLDSSVGLLSRVSFAKK